MALMNKKWLPTNENNLESLALLSVHLYRGLSNRGTIRIRVYVRPNFQLSFKSQGRNHPGINSMQLQPCPLVELLKWVIKRWTIFTPDLKWSTRYVFFNTKVPVCLNNCLTFSWQCSFNNHKAFFLLWLPYNCIKYSYLISTIHAHSNRLNCYSYF